MCDAREVDPAQWKAANDIYSLYFIGWMIGFLAFVIGALWAGRQARRATDFTRSHFQFQCHLALQGVVMLVAVVLANIAWDVCFQQAWSMTFMVVSAVSAVIWWLSRCIAGYRILTRRRAIANPKSWRRPRAESSKNTM